MRFIMLVLFLHMSLLLSAQDKDIDSLKAIVSSNIDLEKKKDALWYLAAEFSWTDAGYSLSLLDSLLEIPSVAGDSTSYMKAVKFQGEAQRAVGNYAKSLVKYQEHFYYHSRNKDTLEMAISAGEIGTLNLFSGNMNRAQDYLLRSYEFYSIKGTPSEIAGANNGLAIFYSDMNQPEKAIERYEMALEMYAEAEDTLGMANVVANMGLLQIEHKQYEEAEKNLRLQGKYDSILGTNWGLGFHHDFMGYLYLEQERYEEAYASYQVALKIREGEQSHYNIDESRTSLARVLLKLGRPQEAISHAERIFDNNDEQQSLSHLHSAYGILAEGYEQVGNYKKAFVNQRELKVIADSIYNRDHLEEIAENDARFNKVEQEGEIALLNTKNAANTRLLGQKNRTIMIGAISLLLISLLSFLLYRVLSKVNVQKAQLSSALRDKDLLIKEIHHRVKNNLQLVSSLLSMQSRTIDDPSVAGAIEDGKSRVRSMALIHQDLYQSDNLKGVNLRSYLEDLSKELFNTYNVDAERVKLELEIDDISLDVDTIIPLGLILNELITNSLKYAFPGDRRGVVSIKLAAEHDELALSVSDNGVGYSVGEAKNRKSFGTKLIRALSKQLDGEVMVNTADGTNIEIKFKKYELA